MSTFSELLSNFVAEKKADIAQMVKYCGFDRSTMYKILKGKRNPPPLDIVYNIGQFLRLTQPELQQLTETWQLTILGPLKYFRRKSVEHFLRFFPDDFSSINEDELLRSAVPADHTQISDAPACQGLDSQMEINSYLRQIIFKEAEKEQGSILMVVQPEYDYLFQTLGSLTPENPITVDHIFCLSNTEALTSDHQLLHIRYLETLFPLFTRKNIGYTPLYYYGDIHSRFSVYNLIPYMILTSDHALLFTSDYQSGIFFSDPGIMKYLHEHFAYLKEKCTPLFRILTADLRDFDQAKGFSNLINGESPAFIIQAEGVLLPFLKKNTILSLIDRSIPGREKLADAYELMLTHSRQLLSNPVWIHQYFTRNGMLHFVRTSDECHPVSTEYRIDLLKEFQKYCKTGVFRMLRFPLEQLSGNLRLAISGKIGYFVLCVEGKPLIYMLFNEPYLVEIFRDYMESLAEFYCYSIEDTVETIQEMIDSL